MRTLKIEKYDGIYAICVDKDKKFFAIETNELPQKFPVGSRIEITDDGEIKQA